MRLVHLDLERGYRGGERQVELLVRELAAAGRVQEAVVRRGAPLAARLAGVPALRVTEVAGRGSALAHLLRAPGPALVHAHTGNTVPLAVLGARGGAALATRRLDRPVTRFWWNQLDRAVAISRSVERALLAVGLSRERVVRIPSAIDRRRTLDPAEGTALRARLGIPRTALVGLTVGALADQKDPLTLAAALEHTPGGYHHVWVGDGPLRARVAARAGVAAARLHLVGHDDAADRWFGAADLFVLPSVHEGLGTVLLDAFHFGLPVAGTRIDGSAELLEDGVSALHFAPGDAAGLAAAVTRLAADAALRARLAHEGMRRVADYDIRATAAAYTALYAALGC